MQRDLASQETLQEFGPGSWRCIELLSDNRGIDHLTWWDLFVVLRRVFRCVSDSKKIKIKIHYKLSADSSPSELT